MFNMYFFAIFVLIFLYHLGYTWNSKVNCISCNEITSTDLTSRRLNYYHLETVIQRKQQNNTIILYCTDSGYINLFLNAYYASNIQKYENFMVACLDKLCYHTMFKLHIPVAIINTENDTLINTGTASTWGTKSFQNKVHWKLVMLIRALELNVRVLYIDSDIVLLKNPLPYLNSISGYDLIAQKDSTICSGFMYLYPTKITKEVLKKAALLRPKLPNAGDQKAILTAVNRTPKIKVFLLPPHIFSSGETFFKFHSYYWDPINKNQIMIHNNFVIGTNNKLYRFKELQLYKLDVNGEYSDPNGKYLTIERWSRYYIYLFTHSS